MTNQEQYEEMCNKAKKYDKLVEDVTKFVTRIQQIKDDHNENGTPINYGTICGLCIIGWNLVRATGEADIKLSYTDKNGFEFADQPVLRSAT